MGQNIFPITQPVQNFDPTKFPTILQRVGTATTSATIGQFTTLLSVAGKSGYFTKIMVTNGSTQTITLKITVDGVVVFNGANPGTPWYGAGICQEHQTVGGTTAGNTLGTTSVGGSFACGLITGTAQQQYPYTGGSTAFIVLDSRPILFNTSLLIEIACTTGASASVPYTIQGGAA